MQDGSFYMALALLLIIVPLGIFVIIRDGYRAKRFSECLAKAAFFAALLFVVRLTLIWMGVDWVSDKSSAYSAILAGLNFLGFLIMHLIGYALASRKRKRTHSAFRTLG